MARSREREEQTRTMGIPDGFPDEADFDAGESLGDPADGEPQDLQWKLSELLSSLNIYTIQLEVILDLAQELESMKVVQKLVSLTLNATRDVAETIMEAQEALDE